MASNYTYTKRQPKNKHLIDWCYARIKAVPYTPSLRWLFYRVLQEYQDESDKEKWKNKKSYKSFGQILKRVRKAFYGFKQKIEDGDRVYEGWYPGILIDEGRRGAQVWVDGFATSKDWFVATKELRPDLSVYPYQKRIVIVCYEALAMKAQFDYHVTKYRVSMIPFGGDASLDAKWAVVDKLEQFWLRYHKPLLILYFGDYDKKGKEIGESAFNDIKQWCGKRGFTVEFVRCGLNPEHIDKYKIEPDFEKGEYKFQWEALNEEQAEEILEDALKKYVSTKAIKEVEDIEERVWKKWCSMLDQHANEW